MRFSSETKRSECRIVSSQSAFSPKGKNPIRQPFLNYAKWLQYCLAILTLSLGALAGRAQDLGNIAGVVVNSWDGNAVPSVIVTVRGTTLATQTDAAGRYRLN